MINELSLTNFKAFSSKQNIPMAPITLIYGENSSGKSSILYSLLLQKQTILESSNPNTGLLYKGTYTDQQNYSRCVSSRDLGKEIEISVKFRPEALTESDMLFNPVYFPSTLMSAEEVFNETEEERLLALERREERDELFLNQNKLSRELFYENLVAFCTKYKYENGGTAIESLKLKNNEDSIAIFKKLKSKIEDVLEDGYNLPYGIKYSLDFDPKAPNNHETYDYYISEKKDISNEFLETILLSNKYSQSKNKKSIDDENSFKEKILSSLEDSVCLLKNGIPIYSNSKSDYYESIIHFLSKNYEKIIRDIAYLGPLRESPKRFSDTTKDIYSSVGVRGENTSSILSRNPEVIKGVNAWLQRLGMSYELTIRELENDEMLAFGDIHSLQIHDLKTGTPLTLCDVGFGISQVLPILTQGFIAEESSTVLIEQPEIHLHPKMQAELGDFFIHRSKQKQFVIETHSEHLLLRLMRRIRETTDGTIDDPDLQLRPHDISVLYVDNKNGNAIVREMKISEDGDSFGDWPEGFFEERAKELF